MEITEFPEEYETIALILVALIALFPAYVFWLGYRRVRTKVMLYPAIAFMIYSLRMISVAIMDDLDVIHIYMEFVILFLFTRALLGESGRGKESEREVEAVLKQKEKELKLDEETKAIDSDQSEERDDRSTDHQD